MLQNPSREASTTHGLSLCSDCQSSAKQVALTAVSHVRTHAYAVHLGHDGGQRAQHPHAVLKQSLGISSPCMCATPGRACASCAPGPRCGSVRRALRCRAPPRRSCLLSARSPPGSRTAAKHHVCLENLQNFKKHDTCVQGFPGSPTSNRTAAMMTENCHVQGHSVDQRMGLLL